MLLQFSVKNFLSIKEEQTFSMLATNLTGHEEDNLFTFHDLSVMKSAVIYGPNASGKSNLISAMRIMRKLVLDSVKLSTEEDKFPDWRFSLDETIKDDPIGFEAIFVVDEKIYRYNFELSNTQVIYEELNFLPKSREALLFKREYNHYKFGEYFKNESKGLNDKTNSNALFLTVAAQFNSQHAKNVLGWFKEFNAISGLESDGYREFTAKKIQTDSIFKSKVVSMMRKADLGIEEIEAKKIDEESLPESLPREIRNLLLKKSDVFTFHKAIANDGSQFLKSFNMEADESEGTKKYFALAGPIIDTLEKGKVLVVDELDSKLHPLLTRHIVQLFNSKESNPNNAQLIFATHDTNLLSLRYFRRDQIWFVNKSEDGASSVYALSDYKDEEGKIIRKDSSIQNEYFQGKFDAIPFIRE